MESLNDMDDSKDTFDTKTITTSDDPKEELLGEMVEYDGEVWRVEDTSGMMTYIVHHETGEQLAVPYWEFCEDD